MARPPKWRHVEFIPDIDYFKPAGIPLRELEEIVLAVEELEAIRLRDLENLEQEQCAERMNISRPTFVRLINGARVKVAKALVNGCAIRIEGGKYKVVKSVKCRDCGYEWRQMQKNDAQGCPKCFSINQVPGGGQRKGWRHGARRHGK